jgi:hypothetical protein
MESQEGQQFSIWREDSQRGRCRRENARDRNLGRGSAKSLRIMFSRKSNIKDKAHHTGPVEVER